MLVLFFLFLLSFSCAAQSEASIQGNEGKLFFVDKVDDTIGDDVIAAFLMAIREKSILLITSLICLLREKYRIPST